LQSLAALNSEFAQDLSGAFAARVRSETVPGADLALSVERAFLLAFARRPSLSELRLCVSSLKTQAEVYRASKASSQQACERALVGLCHMLLCSNEFLYID
jgi:hypothetical protein